MTELYTEALDLLTRAKTQYEIAYKEIMDQHEVEESTFVKSLFPLKRGDRDTNPKFKGSNLIYLDSFCNLNKCIHTSTHHFY